jgi:hypothetical protein
MTVFIWVRGLGGRPDVWNLALSIRRIFMCSGTEYQMLVEEWQALAMVGKHCIALGEFGCCCDWQVVLVQ